MTFRGQNYLSSAIRRVGKDVGSLSRTQALTQQRAQLQTVKQRAISSRNAASAELQSVTTGQRALAVQRARQAATKAEETAALNLRRSESQLFGAQAARLNQANKVATIQGKISAVPTDLASQRESLRLQIQQTQEGSRALSIQKTQVTELIRQNAELRASNILENRLTENEENRLKTSAALQKLQLIQPTSKQYVGVPEKIQASQLALQRLDKERGELLQRQAEIGPEAQARQEAELNRINALEADQARQVAKLTEAYNKLGPESRVQLSQLRQQLAQANIEVARLAEQENILRESVELARKSLQAEGLTMQQVEAREAALAARQAALVDIINTRNDVIANTNARLEQNAMAANAAFWERFQSGARTVEHAGRALQMFGLIGTAVFGYAATQAAEFNRQVTLAATQARPIGAPVSATANIAQQIQKQALTLTTTLPSSTQEISDAFYQVFSGTNIQNVSKATNMIRIFGQAAVAGGSDLATMTQVGITLRNVFGNEFPPTIAGTTKAFNVFFAAVRYGRTNATQLGNALAYIAPIAKDAGLNFQQLAGDIAFVTRQTGGRLTRQDLQGLARLLQLFARKDVTQGLAQRGVKVFDVGSDGVRRMRDVADIVGDIIRKFPELARNRQLALNFFKDISAGTGTSGTQGTIQAIRIFSLFVNQIGDARQVIKQTTGDSNEFIKSWQALSKNPAVQWKIFTNQIKALLIVLGQGAIPVFIKFGEPLEKLIHWFEQLSPHTQRLIGYFTAFVAVGTLVLGTVAALAGGLASLIISFRLMAGFAKGGSGIFGLLGFGTAGSKQAMSDLERIASTDVSSVAKNFDQVGEEAAKNAGQLELFGSEVGSVSLKMGAGLGLLAVIPLLIHFHTQVRHVIDDLGGFKNVITLVGAAIGVLGFARILRGLINIVGEAKTAREALLLLRGSLLGIAGLVVTATILIIERHQIERAIKRAVTGSGIPGIDPKLGFQGINKQGQAIVKYNKGVLGYAESHFGTDATKGIGGFLNRSSFFGTLFNPDNPYARAAIMRNARAANQRFIKAQDKADKENIFGQAQRNFMKKLIPQQDPFTAAAARFRRLHPQDISVRAAKVGLTPAQLQAQHNAEVQRYIKLAVQAGKIAIANPKDLQAQIRYYNILAQISKKYSGSELQAIQAVIDADTQATKKRVSNAKTAAKAAVDQARTQANQVISALQQMYDQIDQQNQQAFGQLFQGPFVNSPQMQNGIQWGYVLRTPDLIQDLKSQDQAFNAWESNLNRLARRHVPFKLIDEIRQQGPGSPSDPNSPFNLVARLAKATPAQLAQYGRLWQRGQTEIHNATMSQLKAQLTQWRKHGQQIALAIITGIKSENVGLTNVFRNIVRQMFPGLRAGLTQQAARAKAATKQAPEAAKRAAVQQKAVTRHTPAPTQKHTHTHIKSAPQTHIKYETHYNVTAPRSEHATIRAQLRHADFVRRNKYSGRGPGPR